MRIRSRSDAARFDWLEAHGFLAKFDRGPSKCDGPVAARREWAVYPAAWAERGRSCGPNLRAAVDAAMGAMEDHDVRTGL